MGLVYIQSMKRHAPQTMSVREKLKTLLYDAISRFGAPCVVLKLSEMAVCSIPLQCVKGCHTSSDWLQRASGLLHLVLSDPSCKFTSSVHNIMLHRVTACVSVL